MTVEHVDGGAVQAVVVYDGRVLLMTIPDGWALPSGTPELAETAEATAARIVYELTGYLVDGSFTLKPQASEQVDARAAVVCQLLSESPSEGGQYGPEQLRWASSAEATDAGLPAAVCDYLKGHTPV